MFHDDVKLLPRTKECSLEITLTIREDNTLPLHHYRALKTSSRLNDGGDEARFLILNEIWAVGLPALGVGHHLDSAPVRQTHSWMSPLRQMLHIHTSTISHDNSQWVDQSSSLSALYCSCNPSQKEQCVGTELGRRTVEGVFFSRSDQKCRPICRARFRTEW